MSKPPLGRLRQVVVRAVDDLETALIEATDEVGRVLAPCTGTDCMMRPLRPMRSQTQLARRL